MNDSYAQFPRWISDSEVFAHPHLLRLYTLIVLRAAFKRQAVSWPIGNGYTTVILERDQAVVGKIRTARDLGWPPSTFWDRLQRLAKHGAVELEPRKSECTIVTIIRVPGDDDVVSDEADRMVPKIETPQPMDAALVTDQSPAAATSNEGWQSLRTELQRIGLAKANEAIVAALERGLNLDQAWALVASYQSELHRNPACQPGYLYRWLTGESPSPQPPKATRRRSSSELASRAECIRARACKDVRSRRRDERVTLDHPEVILKIAITLRSEGLDDQLTARERDSLRAYDQDKRLQA